MTLRHLQIFAEVCRAESITVAAERLNMAQPAVSTVIKELESYYGVRLFDRMNRHIYITQSGSMLYHYTQSILSQLDDIKELLNESAALGTLRVGSNIAFAVGHLSNIIADFTDMHPSFSVYTRIQNPSDLETSLMHNELDFAIADKSMFSNVFYFEQLAREQVGLVCSRSFAKQHFPEQYHSDSAHIQTDLARIAELPMLLREVGSGSRDNIDDIFRNANLTPRIMAESISARALMKLCKQGLGITTLPHSQIQDFNQDSELIELVTSDITIFRDYYLIYHKNKYFTYGMKLFLDYLRNQFPDRILN